MKRSAIFLLFLIGHLKAIDWKDGDGTIWASGCDFSNHDIGSSQVSGDKCGGECAKKSGCTHFTWTSYNGGTCWMKGDSVSRGDAFTTSDSSTVCGIMVNNGITWNNGVGTIWSTQCDFTGQDMGSSSGQGANCGGICGGTSGCTHFTWTSYNSGTCWLKSGSVLKADAFRNNDPSSVCGIMTSSSPGGSCGLFGNGKLGVGINYDALGQVNVNDYDYITIWLNTPDGSGNTNFNPGYQGTMLDTCTSTGKMPAFYAYIIAFEGRTHAGLSDCDVNPNGPNLCNGGACYIQNNRAYLVGRYAHQASQIASRYGSNKPVLFLMEPDYWQYFGDSRQSCKLDWGYARDLFSDFVTQIKTYLPNAIISWDISAWLDQSTMSSWWGSFANCAGCHISFINNSGGQSRADSSNIKPGELTYSFMSQLTGRKIISDCGYGVSGTPDGSCSNWQNQNNLANRINDGVAAISVANPVGGTYPRLSLNC